MLESSQEAFEGFRFLCYFKANSYRIFGRPWSSRKKVHISTSIALKWQNKENNIYALIVAISVLMIFFHDKLHINWAPSSEFLSSSIPSWQILTAHAQPFRGARDLAFCLKVPLDSLLVWARSEGSGETARMRRLAWTFAARICDKYQIRLTRSNYA